MENLDTTTDPEVIEEAIAPEAAPQDKGSSGPEEVTGDQPAVAEYDWREDALKGFESEDERKAAVKFFKSYNDIGSLAAGAIKNANKLREGGLIEPLGEEATQEQKTEFYRSIGLDIPEKPEEYSLGLEESEFNTEVEGIFRNMMSEAGVPSEYAGKVAAAAEALAQEKSEALINEMSQKAQDQIEDWWPTRKEREENLSAASEATKFMFGKEWDEIRQMVLKDGTPLGSYPDFVKGFAQMGRLLAEDQHVDLPIATNTAANAESRIDAIMNEHYGKPSYQSEAVQNEINELTAIVAKDKERAQAKAINGS